MQIEVCKPPNPSFGSKCPRSSHGPCRSGERRLKLHTPARLPRRCPERGRGAGVKLCEDGVCLPALCALGCAQRSWFGFTDRIKEATSPQMCPEIPRPAGLIYLQPKCLGGGGKSQSRVSVDHEENLLPALFVRDKENVDTKLAESTPQFDGNLREPQHDRPPGLIPPENRKDCHSPRVCAPRAAPSGKCRPSRWQSITRLLLGRSWGRSLMLTRSPAK